MELYIQK